MIPAVIASVAPLGVLKVLLFYAALFVLVRVIKPRIESDERKTALAIGILWGGLVFIANFLLYRAGLMSFLPWVNNAMHTWLWIGICLTYLYMGVRESQPLWMQCVLFAVLSLIVKYAERFVFGTWELGHFFYVFHGNDAYVLGWSLADGLYPIITLYGVRLMSRFISGLMPT